MTPRASARSLHASAGYRDTAVGDPYNGGEIFYQSQAFAAGTTDALNDRMMRLIPTLAALASMTLLTSQALAERPDRDRFSVSLHAAGGNLTNADDESDKQLDAGGGGLTARYAFSPRWEIELMGEGLVAEDESIRRNLGIVTIGPRFTFNPHSRWRWSMQLGLGSASEEVEVLNPSGGTIFTREFSHAAVTLGGGIERRWSHIGLSADFRVLALGRDEDALDGPEFQGKDSPIPLNSAGGQLRLLATYYF